MSVDVAAIRARLEAFRDLPWSWRVTDDRRWAVVEDANGDRRARVNDDDLAESIAHSPADVAALLDALAAAEAERDALAHRLTAEQAASRTYATDVNRLAQRLARVEALADKWRNDEMPDPTSAWEDLRAALEEGEDA